MSLEVLHPLGIVTDGADPEVLAKTGRDQRDLPRLSGHSAGGLKHDEAESNRQWCSKSSLDCWYRHSVENSKALAGDLRLELAKSVKHEGATLATTSPC